MNTDWLTLHIWNRSHGAINERLRAAATGLVQVGPARAATECFPLHASRVPVHGRFLALLGKSVKRSH
jgi:hypothetical protein